MNSILGVVLAGGLSRRMDGREKSFIELAGKPLISHVVERLVGQVNEILINANGDPTRFSALGLPVQSDTIEGHAGPLAGVLAGMRWAQENSNAENLVTAAADTPFFPMDYVKSMLSNREDQGAEIALAASHGRHHPVFGLWPVKLADDLEDFLRDEENRKVMIFVERFSHCRVNFEGALSDPFYNVNTPEELLQAEQICGQQVPS